MSEKWRQELKPGDAVDVYVDVRGAYNCESWMPATVDKIMDDLCFIDLKYLPVEYDQTVDLYSTKLALPGSKSGVDSKWKEEELMKEDVDGVVIDCHDGTAWRKSTVFRREIQDKMGRPVEMLKVGYRVYKDEPTKVASYMVRTDERGQYEGFGAAYDEWVPLHSPKVA